jgi:hypothetical protein
MPARMRVPARLPSAAALVAAAFLTVTPAAAEARHGGPHFGRCPVFPKSNQWNQRVDHLPVHPRSDAIVNRIGADDKLHPDFNSGLWRGVPRGMPFNVVGRGQPRVPVSFFGEPEASDPGPYPIPPDARVEPEARNPDRHLLVVDKARCRLYEMFKAFPHDGGRRWAAYAGAVFNMRSNRLRPEGWTSADGAGLPIFPGLVRYREVRRGAIRHAMRLVVPTTRKAWIYPARHATTKLLDPDLPAMGQRLRLKKSVDPMSFPRQARVVVRALQRYGVLVASNGAPWHLSGVPSERWDQQQVWSLWRIHGRDFEVVDTSSLPRPTP